MNIYMIIGLGNPGNAYHLNRHNAGFMAIEKISKKYSFPNPIKKKDILVSANTMFDKKILLVWPMSYINLSGEAVNPLVSFYKIPLNNIVVIHDELAITCGNIRIKKGGSSAGHNGIKNLDHMIGKDYWRIRVGIGHPGDKNRVSDYVLSDFSKDELQIIDNRLDKISDHIDVFFNDGADVFSHKIKHDK